VKVLSSITIASLMRPASISQGPGTLDVLPREAYTLVLNLLTFPRRALTAVYFK